MRDILYLLPAPIIAIIVIVLIIWAVLWFFVPFIIWAMNDKLRNIERHLDEIKRASGTS